jgi:hypothetical protein
MKPYYTFFTALPKSMSRPKAHIPGHASKSLKLRIIGETLLRGKKISDNPQVQGSPFSVTFRRRSDVQGFFDIFEGYKCYEK